MVWLAIFSGGAGFGAASAVTRYSEKVQGLGPLMAKVQGLGPWRVWAEPGLVFFAAKGPEVDLAALGAIASNDMILTIFPALRHRCWDGDAVPSADVARRDVPRDRTWIRDAGVGHCLRALTP